MIHTSRTVTVGKMESVINEPIMLYRGDREVEIEFNIVGSKFMFSNGGNVIKSTNATNGQLVINTPTGENMFSEVTECNDGKVVCVITKEMIDELAEVGFYSFQIRLFDESQVSRVTIPPVYQGIEIRNPIAAEDETDLVDIGLVDFSVVRKDNYENVVTFLPNGDYNKTLWEEHDVISKDRLNKVEDALYEINKGTEGLYPTLQNKYDEFSAKVNKDVKAYKEEMEDEVEQFERDMTQAFGEFKVDYKDEVHDRLDVVEADLEEANLQLAHIENMSAYINIKDFNVTGDGVSDETEKIQNALDYCSSVNKRLYIPKGIYMIKASMGIDEPFGVRDGRGLFIESPLHVVCDDNAVFKLFPNDLKAPSILLIRNTNNVIWKGGKFEGDAPEHLGTTGGGGQGIGISCCDDVLIENVEVYNFWGDGMCCFSWPKFNDKSNCENVILKNCKVFDNGRTGFVIGAVNNLLIDNCEFSGQYRISPKAGINIEPSGDQLTADNISIRNTRFNDNDFDICVTGQPSNNLIIDSCIFKNAKTSHMSLRPNVTNVKIINNTFISMNRGMGIYCKDVFIENNKFIASRMDSQFITISEGGSNINISNNIIENTNIGLALTTSNNVIINANKFYNCGRCLTVANSNNISILNNDFLDMEHDGMILRNGNSDIHICNNKFTNTPKNHISVENEVDLLHIKSNIFNNFGWTGIAGNLNNIFASDNYFQSSVSGSNSIEETVLSSKNSVFTNNILLTKTKLKTDSIVKLVNNVILY